MTDFVEVMGGGQVGLLTEQVLGVPKKVVAGLDKSVVLQHPAFGSPHRLNRDEFNRLMPSSVFMLFEGGVKLIGGGEEAGVMPMGAAAGESGPRPGVMDTRGEDWNCGPVRGLTSESPQAHAERGCPHFFASTNWMMKKDGPSVIDQLAHLMLILVTVATWIGQQQRDVVCHCIPLLFPPRRLTLINDLLVLIIINYFPRVVLGGGQKDPGRPVEISKADRPTLIQKRPEMNALN